MAHAEIAKIAKNGSICTLRTIFLQLASYGNISKSLYALAYSVPIEIIWPDRDLYTVIYSAVAVGLVIFSIPPMYGRNTSGIITDPSSC